MNALCENIQNLLKEREAPVCVSIEGGAGSGKTTLGAALQNALGGNLYHMDDFFLPPDKRTPERLKMPGGNVDFERFSAEVVAGIFSAEAFTYGGFDCRAGKITKEYRAYPSKLHIVEGVYSAHPRYEDIYALRIFLDIDAALQKERILRREGERAEAFFARWIPMENAYFSAYSVKENSDIVLPAH